MTIYIDLIFIENVFMNLIIIFATGIALKKEIKIFRMLFGSIIGAIYSCIYYITNLEIYSNIFLKIILSIAIVFVSFDCKTLKNFLKNFLFFYLISFVFGGLTFALIFFINPKNITFNNGKLVGIYPLKVIMIGGIIGLVLIIFFFRSMKNKFEKKDMKCTLKIAINQKHLLINAIIDTGNFLKDPITNNPVIIVEKDCLKEIIPVDILNNFEEIINGNINQNDEYFYKIRMIPFKALGTENGVILGIKPDDFTIDYQGEIIKNNQVIIGIYNNKLSKNNKYHALIGLDLIEKN